jgi:hypothetical protein
MGEEWLTGKVNCNVENRANSGGMSGGRGGRSGPRDAEGTPLRRGGGAETSRARLKPFQLPHNNQLHQ